MTKTFCDRCGKETASREVAWLTMKHYSTFKFFPIKSRGDWDNRRDSDSYLCQECEDSFIDWFVSGGTK